MHSTRRQFLNAGAMGLGGLALAWLEQQRLAAAPVKPPLAPPVFDLQPKSPHKPPRAKAMISLWMQGGPSHIDLFEPKPEMAKWEGKKFPGEIEYDMANQASDKVLPALWKFQHYGKCGMQLSEQIPHIGGIADEITLVRSMYTGINNHGQSIRMLQAGRNLAGRPCLGSWITYALGSESQELPAFVAMISPGRLPVQGVENWSNGFLPSIYQGTAVRPREPRILNLVPPPHLRGETQASALDYLERLNQRHLENHPGNTDLEARIASYELAAKMQIAATEALDLSQETEATRRMYGLDDPETADFGSRCLLARRLVERGVRFVQIYCGGQDWDHHNQIVSKLPEMCRQTDRPSAALVKDLKQRGLLDTTIVHWGGEMGRLPVVQTGGSGTRERMGRDHNTKGFSMWLAGGGFRAGHVYGATDDFGHEAVEGRVSPHDYHATLFHLFGLDHELVAFRQGGREQSLIDGQSCRVVTEILDG